MTPFKPYDVFNIPADKQEVLQSLSTDTRLTYIDYHDVMNRGLGKTLIVGAAGSGKTRAMYQMLSGELPVPYIVVTRKGLSFAQDVQGLSHETFDGDVFLVWDNIHRISESGSNEAFEAAIHRLEDNLSDQGHTLYVLAAARSEDLDKVPGDVANRQGMWKNYDIIELDEWQQDDLTKLIDVAAAVYDVEIADAAYGGLVQKASGSAAPLYITVLFSQYAGDRFSSQDLMALPDSIRQLWNHYHAKLLDESEDELVVLEACKLLFDVSLEPILTLTEGIYCEVLGKSKRSFRPAINSLHTRGWLQIRGGKDSIGPEIVQIHDTQIQSMDIRISDYFSEIISFFRDDFDRYAPSVRGVPESEVLALLQAETAIGLDVQGADTEDVVELFECALSHQPNHPKILNRYAQFISPTDPGQAESLLRQAIEAGVATEHIHHSYGSLLRDLEEYDAAVEQFKHAIRLNDNYGPGYTGIGLVKYEEFRHRGGGKKAADTAIMNLKKAIQLEEFPVSALNLLGCVLRHKKDYEGSIKLLEYAERMDPNWVGTYINLTSVLRDMDEIEEAITVLKRGVGKNPESQRLHGRLGAFLYLNGRTRNAYKRSGSTGACSPMG